MKPIKIENYKVKRTKRNQWNFENDIMLSEMYDRLMLVAMSVFEWENLPSSVDEIYLERELVKMGQLVFFKEEDMQSGNESEGEGVYFALKFMPSYNLDVYGNPVVRRAYADNYAKYRKNLTQKDSVIIYDNVLKMSMDNIIYNFAKHLTTIKSIIKQNLEHQKRPYLIGADAQLKNELDLFFNQVSEMKPYFMIRKETLADIRTAIQVYPTNVELLSNELNDYYDAVWNEFMTFVGVGTNASPKRERLVSAEVSSVNEQAQAFANARFKTRQRACKMINEMFNLNVNVRFAFDKMEGGAEDGTVHDIAIDSAKESSKR